VSDVYGSGETWGRPTAYSPPLITYHMATWLWVVAMPTIRVEVYPDVDLATAVEQFAETNNLAVSAAWQELARRGLEVTTDE